MERGCEWVGTVGTLEKHVATCGFTLVPCPTQCKDNALMKKDIDQHLKKHCPNRVYFCIHCGEKGTYTNITLVHDRSCERKILHCPNAGCDDDMERREVSEHVSKCPHTVVPCKYKGIGCDTELKREDMAAHEQDDKLHLHMALETVNSQQRVIDSLRSLQHTTASQRNDINKLQYDITLQQETISNMQHTILSQQTDIKQLCSAQEISTTHHVRAVDKLQNTTARHEATIGKLTTLHADVHKLQNSVALQEGGISKLKSTLSLQEGATSTLKDTAGKLRNMINTQWGEQQDSICSQESDINALQDVTKLQESAIAKLQNTTTSQAGAIGSHAETIGSHAETIGSHAEAIDKLKDTTQNAISKLQETSTSQFYTMQDVTATLAANIQTLKTYTPYVLSGYQMRKDAGTDYTFPNPFYTHPGGYLMTLRVDANGCGPGKGTHVSVFASILLGRYNAGLKWPFTGSIMFTLLNQLEDKNHTVMTVTLKAANNARIGGQPSWGFAEFIPHTDLAYNKEKNVQYLKDDALYFRVFVKVAGRKPWLE